MLGAASRTAAAVVVDEDPVEILDPLWITLAAAAVEAHPDRLAQRLAEHAPRAIPLHIPGLTSKQSGLPEQTLARLLVPESELVLVVGASLPARAAWTTALALVLPHFLGSAWETMPVMVSVLQAAVPMWAAWVTAVALVPLCVLDFAWGAASALVQALALVLPAQSPDLVMVPVRALVPRS